MNEDDRRDTSCGNVCVVWQLMSHNLSTFHRQINVKSHICWIGKKACGQLLLNVWTFRISGTIPCSPRGNVWVVWCLTAFLQLKHFHISQTDRRVVAFQVDFCLFWLHQRPHYWEAFHGTVKTTIIQRLFEKRLSPVEDCRVSTTLRDG